MASAKRFKTKKLTNGKSVGERLESARKSKEISLEEAENETKIRAKYLEALEKDDFSAFTSEIYALGFLRRYAIFLGLSVEDLVADFSLLAPRYSRRHETLAPPRTRHKRAIIVTPKMFIVAAVVMAVIGIISYVTLQVREFSAPPPLSISQPTASSSTDKAEIVVKGTTDAGAIVTINGEVVPLSVSGEFSQTVKLVPGLNTIGIVSKNRIDRATATEVKVLYNAPAVPIPSPSDGTVVPLPTVIPNQ